MSEKLHPLDDDYDSDGSRGTPLCSTAGYRLYTRTLTVQGAVGHFVLFHGLDSHSHRPGYARLAALMHTQQYSFHMLDFAGHGLSEGPRSLVDHRANIADATAFVQRLLDAKEGHVVVGGVSMGGAVATEVVSLLQSTHRIAGLFLAAPAFRIANPPHWSTRALLGAVAAVLPQLRVPIGGGPLTSVWKDPAIIAYVEQDPLAPKTKGIRLGTARALLSGAEEAQRVMHTINVPFFILQGDADTVTLPSGCDELRAACKTPPEQQTMMLIPGGLHGILDDYHYMGLTSLINDALCAWLSRI